MPEEYAKNSEKLSNDFENFEKSEKNFKELSKNCVKNQKGNQELSESILRPLETEAALHIQKSFNVSLNKSQAPLKAPFYFLNVYKPKGITSFDVIYKLRKRLGVKKIGHSGTLDPLADGVMQVAVGGATRLLDYLSSDKAYRARVKFGYFSTTGDAEGEIFPADPPKFSLQELQNALKSMTGVIEQIPPIYSAIKVGGKKLCDLARKAEKNKNNIEKQKDDRENVKLNVEIPKRIVTIYEAKILSLTPENENLQNFTMPFEIEIEVSCSKGTYIRTFAEDLAKKLGTGAYLTALTRIRAGNFTLENSVKIEDITPENTPKNNGINPIQAIDLLQYNLTNEEYKLVLNGVAFLPRALKPSKDTSLALVFENNLVSIGVLSDNKIIPKKVFK